MKIQYLTLLVALAFTSCGQRKSAPAPAEKTSTSIYTTFYPTQYFAERITGESFNVDCPVPADEDAIFWKPDAATIAKYQAADLIILNGASFAKWVEQANLPASRIVNSAASFKSEFITFENAVTHQHGDKGEHSHEGIDGHTWVDPVNARIQAKAIQDGLIKKWPDQKALFEKNFALLAADLDSLDSDFKKISNATPLLTSHPAYNYIARRYQWNIHNLNLDPEEMPDDATFAAIKKVMETHPAKQIIWEGPPLDAIAARFQSELGLESAVFSPCELAPESGDYLSVMRENIETMRKVFESGKSE